MKKKVLAVIVTFNAMNWLDRCLGSLRKSEVSVDAFVVDNGSTDGTQERITNSFPEVTLYQSAENLGFGAANNIGFRYALEHSYDYVYLLNQDAWIEPDTIGTMIAAWQDGFGILSPMQKTAKGKLDKNFSRKCGKYINGLNEVETVPFVMAAHWLMDIKTIKLVGGFSPAFKMYGEDDNYIHRLHYHGLKCGIVTKADAVHDRAKRKESKERKMNLKCVSRVVRLSDPCRSFLQAQFWMPVTLLGMSIKNFSTVPLKFLPTLRARYAELKQLRKESTAKGAFLS